MKGERLVRLCVISITSPSRNVGNIEFLQILMLTVLLSASQSITSATIPLARVIVFFFNPVMIGLVEHPEIQQKLILASGSPRRRDLLKAAGLTFEIVSPDVEELTGESLKPRDLSLMNARLKACAVGRNYPEDLVIGSDTVVALGGEAFGKPVDLNEARGNLKLFRGRVHEVITGVSIVRGEEVSEFVETSYVKFRDFSDEVIEEYLGKVPVLDKAGGYAIQDHGDLIVEKVEGDFDNIVGLPVAKVLDHLRFMGFPLPR